MPYLLFVSLVYITCLKSCLYTCLEVSKNLDFIEVFEVLGTANVPQGTNVVPRGTSLVPQGTSVVPAGTSLVPQGTNDVPQNRNFHISRYERKIDNRTFA